MRSNHAQQAFPNYSSFDFNLDSQPEFYSIANGHAPIELEIQGNGRSSSEEKDLTPGQRVSYTAHFPNTSITES
jgi:hypothetical protein